MERRGRNLLLQLDDVHGRKGLCLVRLRDTRAKSTSNIVRQSLCLAQPRRVLRVRRVCSLVWLTQMTWGASAKSGIVEA